MRSRLPRFPLAWLAALAAGAAAAAGAEWTAIVRDQAGAPVADAVVSLHPLDAPVPPPDPAAPVVEIAQQDRQYQPLVTAVRVGTTVEFPNRDPIQHHLYSVSKAKRFEKPLYDGGSRETVVFDQPGVVTLGCNIHDWMIAYVVVLPTPWFAKTAADGRASIAAVPAGRHRVEVWHPRQRRPLVGETLRPPEDAASGEPEAFTLELKPERRLRRAPDGTGRGY